MKYLLAGQLILAGLGVVGFSFIEEVLPVFREELDTLMRIGVLLFFLAAAYFLVSLICLFVFKSSKPGDERYDVDGVNVKIEFKLHDPATHVMISIVQIVIAAVLLTMAVM